MTDSRKFRKVTHLPPGDYSTVAKHHPYIYMHARRIRVDENNKCWMITDPKFVYDVEHFFKYNFLYFEPLKVIKGSKHQPKHTLGERLKAALQSR